MIKDRKVKQEIIKKEDTSHEIRLKKFPKKAENKYYVFECNLYIGNKKINNEHIAWYIESKTHPEIYANLTETGTLVVDIEGLKDVHGSVTIVAKYKEKQYYHILKRWRDKNRRKSLGLGLGLGLGIPILAGAIVGIVYASQSCSYTKVNTNDNIVLVTKEVSIGIDKEICTFIVDKSNTPISFKKIKSATSSDESILKVKGLSYRANLSGVVRVDTLKEGTVTLSLVSIDNDDCEVRAKFTVKVVNNLNEINVDDEGDNCVYDASVLSLEDNTDGTSIGLSVNDMLGASFEIKQPVKGVWINDSNLIVDANSIFKPTFVTIQSEGCIDLTIVITPISFK